MRSCVLLAAVASCLVGCQGDVNVTEYIKWMKADINAWHQFFPSRALEEERLTILAAQGAVWNMSRSLPTALSRIVAFQQQELATAKSLMAGTNAEGCINGIAGFMDQAVSDEFDTYSDCSADALSKISRQNTTWAKLNTTYMAAYQRALQGIDTCTNTYPNKESFPRLQSCVESMKQYYVSAANTTKAALKPSPTMSYFQNNVVECASYAARAVTAKGHQFLDMLVQCAHLCGNIDPDQYAQELSQWPGYNDTLPSQILSAQNANDLQISSIEHNMMDYYQIQKQVLEQYVIESRGLDFYLQSTFSILSEYYNSVILASLDNSGDTTCGADAKWALDSLAYKTANKSLTCDLHIVNDTKDKINKIFQNFSQLNTMMVYTGNVAILNSIAGGFIFAPNTIAESTTLSQTLFNLDTQDSYAAVAADASALSLYLSFYSGGNDSPCGGTSRQRLLLGGETALYAMERCQYMSSGSTYMVTTPTPVTTPYSTAPPTTT